MKDRMKSRRARLRMTTGDIKKMVDRLRMIADLPDPVGAVSAHGNVRTGCKSAGPRPDRGDRVVSELSPAHYGGVDRALLQVG